MAKHYKSRSSPSAQVDWSRDGDFHQGAINLLIRGAALADLDWILTLSALCYPERPEDLREWREAVESEAEPPLRRYLLAEAGGVPVGYVSLRPDLPRRPESGKFRLSLAVAPERRCAGVGSALLDRLEAASRELGGSALRARCRHDSDEALRFLARRGFREWDRMVHVELEVAACQADLTALAAPLTRSGFSVTTLAAELARRPDCLTDLNEMSNAAAADVPAMDPFQPFSQARFEQMVRDPRVLPDGFFIALNEGRYIGFSFLGRSGDGSALGQWMTGVTPEYRRSGIAIALKALTVRYARENGYSRIRTANMASNRGIRAINERLGFRFHHADVRLEKVLAQE